MRLIDPRERILAYSVVDENGCWIWQRSLNKEGYGWFSVDDKTRYVHQVSYLIFRGPIDAGMQIDHTCRVRSCCNPYHLDVVTPAENTRRAIFPPRIPKTHCVNGHEYTSGNTYLSPRGGYFCRTCNRLAVRNYQKSRGVSL